MKSKQWLLFMAIRFACLFNRVWTCICYCFGSSLSQYRLELNWKCKGFESVRFCILTHSQYISDSCLAAQISDVVMAWWLLISLAQCYIVVELWTQAKPSFNFSNHFATTYLCIELLDFVITSSQCCFSCLPNLLNLRMFVGTELWICDYVIFWTIFSIQTHIVMEFSLSEMK